MPGRPPKPATMLASTAKTGSPAVAAPSSSPGPARILGGAGAPPPTRVAAVERPTESRPAAFRSALHPAPTVSRSFAARAKIPRVAAAKTKRSLASPASPGGPTRSPPTAAAAEVRRCIATSAIGSPQPAREDFRRASQAGSTPGRFPTAQSSTNGRCTRFGRPRAPRRRRCRWPRRGSCPRYSPSR
jgi:hypothetical protein